jgi:hypothetical protein
VIETHGIASQQGGVAFIKAFFLAASQASLLTFVSVFRRAASCSFPYLSCRPCLPLRCSFPVVQNIFRQRGFCSNRIRPILVHYNPLYFSSYIKLPLSRRSNARGKKSRQQAADGKEVAGGW